MGRVPGKIRRKVAIHVQAVIKSWRGSNVYAGRVQTEVGTKVASGKNDDKPKANTTNSALPSLDPHIQRNLRNSSHSKLHYKSYNMRSCFPRSTPLKVEATIAASNKMMQEDSKHGNRMVARQRRGGND